MHMDKLNIYFSNGKKLRENARWNVNKTIRCLVRNKIKHRKKYEIGKSPTPLGKISILPPGVGEFPILYSPCVRLYISYPGSWVRQATRPYSRKIVFHC